MQYKLHQIHLTDAEVDQVNAEGHDSVHKQKLKLDMNFGDTPSVARQAMDLGYYNQVALIEADSLEGVFHVGNVGPEEAITRLKPMYSVSVGDVVEAEDGTQSVVASFGFKQLAPSNQGLTFGEQDCNIYL